MVDLKSEIIESLEQTSVKGVPRLFKVKSLHLKALWACAVLAFLGVGIYDGIELFVEFYSYPKLTLLHEHEFSAEEDYVFPTLQVCNANPIWMLRSLPETKSFDSYSNLVTQVTKCRNCSKEDSTVLNDVREELISFKAYTQYIGLHRIMNVSQNYTDFMAECAAFKKGSHISTDCKEIASIDIVPSCEHLLCLELTFPKDVTKHKVSMTFFIDSYTPDTFEYNNAASVSDATSTGVVYSIHHHDVIPTSSDADIPLQSAPPGMLTTVTMEKELYSRLPDPGETCVSQGAHYSQDKCFGECLQRGFLRLCNCTFLTPLGESSTPAPPCLSVELPQADLLRNQRCSSRVKKSLIKECSYCKHACSEVKYKTLVSYTKWPLPQQYTALYHRVIKSKPYSDKFKILSKTNTSRLCDARYLVEDNFVKINFILDSTHYYELKEVPKYTVFSFLGTLGGALNLWTGITVVVVIEILETIINIVYGFFKLS